MTKNYEAKDRHTLLTYNALDCIATSRVFAAMQQEAEWREPRVKRLYEVHVALAAIAAEMHDTGVLVDKRQRQFMAMCLRQIRAEKVEAFEKVLGRKIKPTPDNMRRLLFAKYGNADVPSLFNLELPDDPKAYSENGEPSVGKDALIRLFVDPAASDHLKEVIKAFWAAEKPQKSLSTFIEGKKVLQAIGLDGRLRAGWNTCGTDTMRWACSEPNVMNLQQEMRAMYRAARGKVFVHADKSQLELRVMAARAPDRELQRRLDAGDVYTADGIDWFQLPPETTKHTIKPAARRASKIIHLGSQYHAGLRAVYQQCLRQDPSITYKMAATLHAGFLKTYSDTVEYWDREHAQVLLCGYSEGAVLGGRRYYPQPPPVTETANYPIQRTAAEMMNLETIEVHRRLKKLVPSAKLVFQLHDAVDVECYKRDARTVISVLEDVMNNATYSILGKQHTFPIEVKTGEHWSDV